MVSYHYENIPKVPFDEKEVLKWIKNTAAFYGKRTGNIACIFCSDERILEINRQFLQHDYYTDIITFDYSDRRRISGDIFISVDTVRSNAGQYGIRFEDELHRIIIHGVLHLCEQNDKTPEDRAEMTRKENLALRNVEIK